MTSDPEQNQPKAAREVHRHEQRTHVVVDDGSLTRCFMQEIMAIATKLDNKEILSSKVPETTQELHEVPHCLL